MSHLDLPSSSRVAARFLLASPIEMDLYARARIIEAAAGLPKWTFSKKLRAFIIEGPHQFPEVHPDWFSNRDQGLASAVLGAAKKILLQGGEVGVSTAEEVAQNMAAGFTESGVDRSDLYGDVGKHRGSDILAGKFTPGQARATLWALAQRRAVDTWRKNTRRRRDEVSPSEDDGAGEGSTVGDPGRSRLEVMLHLLTDDTVEGSRQFRNWLYRISQKAPPAQALALELSFAHIARSHRWPKPEEIYEQYMARTGKPVPAGTKPTRDQARAVSKARDFGIRFIKEKLDANPEIIDWMDRHLDLASLGYGGGALRLAKVRIAMIQRLVEQFLSSPSGSFSP